MAKYKIEHDRTNCIGCSACVGVDGDLWEMGDDNKSNLKGAKMRDDGWEELDIEEDKHAKAKEAEEACPVNVIHVKNLEDSGSTEEKPAAEDQKTE